jgi:hypothetical protein
MALIQEVSSRIDGQRLDLALHKAVIGTLLLKAGILMAVPGMSEHYRPVTYLKNISDLAGF